MLNSKAIKYYATHPVPFVEDIIKAQPDAAQADILNSIVVNQMTSVRSGHGVGKSAVEAWAIIWFMLTRPFPKIPCTAPTAHQLNDILWAEINKWKRNNPLLEKELVWTKERLYLNGYPEEWFATARTASNPDALQGFHAEHVLFIIDEASGVDDDLFQPVLGALSTPGARLLMCGNPTQLSGFFYESHNRNREKYKTFHIDSRTSPRVSQDYVKTLLDMYGEDSNIFRVRVAGDFPTQEDDVFIPLSLVEKSIQTEFSPRKSPFLIHIAADIARFGDDKTVIGYRVDEKTEFYKKRQGQDTMRTADDIVQCGLMLLEKYHPVDPIPIKVDDGGVGGGVVDRLRQIKRNDPTRFWWMNIIPVKFGVRIKHRYYYDSTTYMMGVLRNLLSPHDEKGNKKPCELILPDDNALVGQLSTRRYDVTDNSMLRIESKDDYKERAKSSPDEADCILLLALPVKPPKKKGDGDGK